MGGCCCKKRTGGHSGYFGKGLTFNTPKLTREEIMAYNKIHVVHQILDQADFDEQLKAAGSKLVVIDFFATWCGPCKVIGPELEKLAVAMPNIVFLKVDVDDLEEITSQYNITVMPTFVVVLEGKRVGDMSGANIDKLKAFIIEKDKTERQDAANNDEA